MSLSHLHFKTRVRHPDESVIVVFITLQNQSAPSQMTIIQMTIPGCQISRKMVKCFYWQQVYWQQELNLCQTHLSTEPRGRNSISAQWINGFDNLTFLGRRSNVFCWLNLNSICFITWLIRFFNTSAYWRQQHNNSFNIFMHIIDILKFLTQVFLDNNNPCNMFMQS